MLAPAELTAATVGVSARRLRLRLKSPYKLSFGAVEAFDTVLVTARIGDVIGYGEATVLTGYTEETIEGSWALARSLVERHGTGTVAELLAEADRLTSEAPFTATAFRTAVEMAARHPLLVSETERRIPVLAIINAIGESKIAAEIDARRSEGYKTLKIKAGFDRVADLARVRFIQSLVAGTDIQLTVDANQGYSREDGCAFAAQLSPDNILFFEQACHKDDWDAAVAVAQISAVPIMLDESIYDLGDVERAASLRAAQYVKLKLMKCGGLDRLAAALARVKALGLKAVLGNGVATDIGCWMEAAVAYERLETAGEMNGFLKPMRHLVTNPLAVEQGHIVVPAGWWPALDEEAVSAYQLDAVGRA